MIQVQNYINGEFTTTKDTIDDINPATGEIIAKIPKSGSKEISNAVTIDTCNHHIFCYNILKII